MQSGAYLILSINYFVHFYSDLQRSRTSIKVYLSLFNLLMIAVFAGSLSNYLIAFQYLKSALAVSNPFRIKYAIVFEHWFLVVSAICTLTVQISVGVYILEKHELTEYELFVKAYLGLGYSLPSWLHYMLVVQFVNTLIFETIVTVVLGISMVIIRKYIKLSKLSKTA